MSLSGRDVVETRAEAAGQDRAPLVVLEPLRAFLDDAGWGSGPLTAVPIGDGHSNVTYELIRGEARGVLRRPPRPPFPASAHDVLREAKILRALSAAGLSVPRVLAASDDPAILGVPFFLMEHVAGQVFGPLEQAPGPAAGRSISEAAVDGLVAVHAVDIEVESLRDLGRPDGYLERQVRRFASIWQERRTRDLPELDRVQSWLSEHLPNSAGRALVHGDYRLGNLMFSAEDSPRLLAMLDWEMATLGDPLADLGYLCATWAQPDDIDNPLWELSAVTRLPGFLTRGELRERYARLSGREVGGLRWYEVLALWKAAVFLESSYRRYLDKSTDDPYFGRLGAGVPLIAQAALERTGATTAPARARGSVRSA
jgi:aminoglycoside phosphotransferase (APT) family kinase protein